MTHEETRAHHDRVLQIRMPSQLREALERASAYRMLTVSDIVRDTLQQSLRAQGHLSDA